MKKIKLTRFVIAFGVALLFYCCETRKSERELVKDFKSLDRFLKTGPFNYDTLKTYLAKIDKEFIYSENKQISYDAWKTAVNYKWNSDSSITMLNSHKTFPKGFSREVIIHSGDSILFIHRFSTEPLDVENREDFTFLESVYYLTEKGTIKHLSRIEYEKQDLRDTVEFRKRPFTNLTDKVSHYYSLELNYSKNILAIN